MGTDDRGGSGSDDDRRRLVPEARLDKDQAFTSPEFIAGALLYGLTAIGWVVVMREMTLGAIGVWFSITVLLMLTALGVIVFKETLGPREILGIALAVVALGLMSRFA